MPFVAVLSSVHDRMSLTEALVECATVQVCEYAHELVALGSLDDCVAVVSGLRDAGGANAVPFLLTLQQRATAIPLLVSISLNAAEARGVVRATEQGLRATWVIRHAESLASAVRHAVVTCAEPDPTSILLRAVSSVVAPATRPFFTFAAVGTTRPVRVRDAARALGVAERTLEERLRRAGAPPPRRVLGCCRMLHAAWRLDVLGQAPKQVAAGLHFPSVAALYNHFHGYGAPPPASVREQQGFQELLRQFMDALERGRRAS